MAIEKNMVTLKERCDDNISQFKHPTAMYIFRGENQNIVEIHQNLTCLSFFVLIFSTRNNNNRKFKLKYVIVTCFLYNILNFSYLNVYTISPCEGLKHPAMDLREKLSIQILIKFDPKSCLV